MCLDWSDYRETVCGIQTFMDSSGQEAVIQSQELSSATADLRDQFCASQNLNSAYSAQIQDLQQQLDELNTTNDANEEELGYLRHQNHQLQQEMQQLITAHSEELAARYPFLLLCIVSTVCSCLDNTATTSTSKLSVTGLAGYNSLRVLSNVLRFHDFSRDFVYSNVFFVPACEFTRLV